MRGHATPVERRIRLWILLQERSRKAQPLRVAERSRDS